MKTHRHLVMLAVMALLMIQSAPLFDSTVLAGQAPGASSPVKKKKTVRKRKQKILKSRHGKRHGKPA